MNLTTRLLITLALLPFLTHAARNLTADVLAWTPNMTVLSNCVKNFTEEAVNTAADEKGVMFLPKGKPSQYWLVQIPFGMANVPIGSFANSDASLCASCNSTIVAFSPDRLEPSYTAGWPELALVTATEAAAVFAGFRVPKSLFKVVLILLLALWHFACHTRVWAQYFMDSRTGPWMWGDSWALILASLVQAWDYIRTSADVPERDEGNSGPNLANYTPPPPLPAPRVARRARMFGFLALPFTFLVVLAGLGSLASGLVDGVLIYLGSLIANKGPPRSRAYDLNSSIPIECVGLIPPYLPAPRHAIASQFWLAELVTGWIVFVALLRLLLSKRKSKLLRWCVGLVVFGWFAVLRPIEIALSVFDEQQGNIVLNYGKCCVVMPSLVYGNMRDKYGLKLAVIVRALGLT